LVLGSRPPTLSRGYPALVSAWGFRPRQNLALSRRDHVFTEAALGCRIEVPTVEGAVKVRVPAGVQSGQKLRLSGRGAPSLRGGVRGDLFITIQVVTPVAYDARSQELLRELARLHPDDPRRDLIVSAEKGKGVVR